MYLNDEILYTQRSTGMGFLYRLREVVCGQDDVNWEMYFECSEWKKLGDNTKLNDLGEIN